VLFFLWRFALFVFGGCYGDCGIIVGLGTNGPNGMDDGIDLERLRQLLVKEPEVEEMSTNEQSPHTNKHNKNIPLFYGYHWSW